MSNDKLRPTHMTIHDCSRVEVEVDQINGCMQVICFGPGPRSVWSSFTLTLFSPEDTAPELMPVTYIDPPQDEYEDQDEEKSLEYADKHGA